MNRKEIRRRAKNYRSLSAFRRGDPDAHRAARAAGLLDSLFTVRVYRRWTLASARKAARPYATRTDLRKADSGLYHYARTNGHLDVICKHMGR